jgi:glucose-6-phosphate 1-dehydrogenase
MKNNKPTILIIIGISGDLSRRKLLPAIGAISTAGMIPAQFKIVGVTRQQNIKLENLLKNTTNKNYLLENIELFEMDLNNVDDYEKLGDRLKEIEKEFKSKAQYLFYLSVPPNVSKPIIEMIGKAGLGEDKETKILLEKPFGTDLESSRDLINHIDKYFKQEQVYRIDHYLAKETAQNIIVFREGNSLFKKTWNKDFIEKIEIVVSEEIGIEGRAGFYEQTGALRDFQSHLFQLLALILMKLPEDDALGEVPFLRLKTLKHISIKDIHEDAVRGQYEGYKDEVNNSDSFVETFFSINLTSGDERWVGVPITITTGKALDRKLTEIKILYKKEKEHESNELLLQLQPKEEIQFNMWAKRPGYEHTISPHTLSFKYKEYYDVLPEAYEQVLWNAMNSDHSLFTTSDEILESWRIIDGLQKMWEKNNDGLVNYKKGSTIDKILNKSHE